MRETTLAPARAVFALVQLITVLHDKSFRSFQTRLRIKFMFAHVFLQLFLIRFNAFNSHSYFRMLLTIIRLTYVHYRNCYYIIDGVLVLIE